MDANNSGTVRRRSKPNNKSGKRKNRNSRVKSTKSVQINLSDLDNSLVNLRKISNIHINDLSNEQYKHFKRITESVGILNETDSYYILLDRVKRNFGDINEVIPGTIGSYFRGCLLNVSMGNRNIPSTCSPICAGSLPKSKDLKSCSNIVVLAKTINSGYDFDVLHHPSNSYGVCILYIINLTDIRDFRGFSYRENKILKEIGIKKIHLMGYEDNKRQYIELSPAPVLLSDIKRRSVERLNNIVNKGVKDHDEDDYDSDSDHSSNGRHSDRRNRRKHKKSKKTKESDSSNMLVTSGISITVIIIIIVILLIWRRK